MNILGAKFDGEWGKIERGPDASTHPVSRLQDRDMSPGGSQAAGGGDPGRTCPENDDVGGVSHVR
jgi:hypothetical protein